MESQQLYSQVAIAYCAVYMYALGPGGKNRCDSVDAYTGRPVQLYGIAGAVYVTHGTRGTGRVSALHTDGREPGSRLRVQAGVTPHST
eukprot:6277133-Prymnesium_polylepis.1